MNNEDREMLIETHAFCKMNHKALYGNGKAGLIERVDKADGARKATAVIGGALFTVISLVIAVLELME